VTATRASIAESTATTAPTMGNRPQGIGALPGGPRRSLPPLQPRIRWHLRTALATVRAGARAAVPRPRTRVRQRDACGCRSAARSAPRLRRVPAWG
jgi:hypothetical protein